MASTVKIKTHGNTTLEGLELENFSTEETLVAILDQIKTLSTGVFTKEDDTKKKTEKHQSKLEKWFQQLTGGAVGGVVGGEVAAGSNEAIGAVSNIITPLLNSIIPFGDLLIDFAELTPEILLVVVAFKAVTAVLHIFQSGLNLVSRSITSIFTVAGNFIGTILSGKTAMSDYFAALQRGTDTIPIIGTLTKFLSEGINIIDSWNQSLIELTKNGANFGGNITDLVNGAADAGLTVEEFSRVIKENVDSLSTFGSVMNGVNTYTKVSKIGMADFSGQLADMGISFSQYSEELPKILNLFGASAKAHGASDRDLAQSSINLIAQFDTMSQLTGKTREQQEADLAKLTDDAAWQQKLTHMTQSEAANYTQALSEIQSTTGNAYAELYKLSVLGIPPLTKELQNILSTTPGLRTEFERMTAAVKAGGPQLGEKLDTVASHMVAIGLKAGQSYETLIAASTAGMSGAATDIAAVQKDLLANRLSFYKNGVFQEEEYKKQITAQRIHLENVNKLSSGLLEFSNIMMVLRDNITTNVIVPLVSKIGPLINMITTELGGSTGPLNNLVSMISNMVDQFGGWLKKEIASGNFKIGIDRFIKVIVGAITIMVDLIPMVGSMIAWVVENWDSIKSISVAIMQQVIYPILVLVLALTGVIILALWPLIMFGQALISAVKLLTKFTNGLHHMTDGIAHDIAKFFGVESPNNITDSVGSIPENNTPKLLVNNQLYDHFKNTNEEKAKENPENVSTQNTSNPLPVDTMTDKLDALNSSMLEQNHWLRGIHENTAGSLNINKKQLAVTQ
jgi:hypothetical protein